MTQKESGLKGIAISIFLDSDGNYQYNIAEDIEELSEGESLDGGACTTTIVNALEMATEQAQGLLASRGEYYTE